MTGLIPPLRSWHPRERIGFAACWLPLEIVTVVETHRSRGWLRGVGGSAKNFGSGLQRIEQACLAAIVIHPESLDPIRYHLPLR